MEKPSNELKNTTYEIFIAALSILSIVNLFLYYLTTNPDVFKVVEIMNGVLSVIFLGDFSYRLFTADSKSGYFFRQFGWADLLASLPFPQAKLLRIFRLFRAGRMIRKYGMRHLVTEFLRDRGGSALLTVLFLMIMVLEFGSMAMLAVESRSPDANIKTGSDAVWYTYVTITTVGYGDRYPVTNLGRFVGVIVLTLGVGLFGTLTGFLANFFLAPKPQEDSAASSDPAEASDSLGSSDSAASSESRPNGQSQPSPLPAKLVELHELLAEQQKAQLALQTKLAELEQMLQQANSDPQL